MTLTQITEKGIKDGEIVNADINASAAIAKSKLASLDIVNADVNASAAIAKSKIETFVNTNADNRVITGSGTANTLNGEAGLTFNNSILSNAGSGYKEISISASTNNSSTLRLQNSSANFTISNITGGTFTVADGGTSRLGIDSNGNVGIGTTAPDTNLHLTGDTPKLRIESTNSLQASLGTEEIGRIEFEGTKGSNINVAASMRVRQDGTWSTSDDFFSPTAIEFYTQDQSGSEITSPRLVIDNGGKLLIGHSTRRLTASVNPAIQLEGVDNHSTSMSLIRNSDNSGGANLLFAKTRGTSTGSNTIVNNGDQLGIIRFCASDGTDLLNQSASIQANIDAAVGTNDTAGRLSFNTTSAGSNTVSERMRITSSGKVGIGTTSPATLLNLDVDTEANLGSGSEGIRLTSGSSNTQLVRLGSSYSNNSVTGPGTLLYSSNKLSLRCDNGNPITFHTGSTVAERMRIDSSGRVFIGTTSVGSYPKKLNIQGQSGSIIHLNNYDTTTYAANTSTAIEFNLNTGNTGNQTGAVEIRAFKENGTNGNNARALSFYTGANGASPSERLRIASDGKVGIGITSPNTKLDISAQSVNSSTLSTTNCKELGQWIQADSHNNTTGHIQTGIALAEGHAGLYSIDAGSGAAQHLAFFTGASAGVAERMKIKNNGHIVITSGNLEFASGSGIDFSLAPDASGVSSNLFDDYEEGSWTPSLNKAGAAGNADSQVGIRAGYYVKSGRMLWISFYWYSGNLSFGTGSNAWYIGNVPFNLLHNQNSAYQFIPGGYLYQNAHTGVSHQAGYRWQSNNTNGAATITMYGQGNTTNASGGAWEFSGCGVLKTAS